MTDSSQPTNAKITVGDSELELNTWPASIGSPAIDISKLLQTLKVVTYDPGFANTASTRT